MATRREQERLQLYVDDRIRRFGVGILLYVGGCFVAYLAIGIWLSLAAFALLFFSDLLDLWSLKARVRPFAEEGCVQRAQKWALFGGFSQGVGFALAPSFYFFNVAEPNIIFVIGALGLGAVNSAMVLPQNRPVGMARLILYGIVPLVMVLIQKYVFGHWEPVVFNDPALTMLLGCMFYMMITFSKAGLVNHQINQALFQSREELRQANAHMASQQAEMRRLSQVAQRANDTIIITDKDRTIVWVNEAFTKNSGYSAEEAMGENIAQLMTHGDPEMLAENDIDIAAAAHEDFRGVLKSKRKDGSLFWSEANLFPILDKHGEVEFFVTIERDMTEARQLAQEMAEARAQAEAGARAKAEFLANMSHEIRTPLSGVMGTVDLLAETELTEEQTRYTDTIRGSSLSLMAIINDILDLSKLDAGRMEMNPVAFSPEACFRETLDLLAPMARAKNLSLKLHIGQDLPVAIKADDGRLRQVLTNILGNAIKFTERGSVTLEIRMGDKNTLCFDVVDTGIGIAEEKLGQIFEHFSQAETSTTRRFGGTGLGLTISRHIVEAMGGRISVASQLGKGSVFHVCVPVAAASAEELKVVNAATTRGGAVHLREGLSILIAEDNQTNRFLLGKYLKDQPVDVTFAKDGLEALELAAGRQFDLVFMDMSMPKMGGVDATREIRKLLKPQPMIVALTAHAFAEERAACLEAGMDDFLTKPIRKAEFLNWILAFQNGENARRNVA